MFFPKRRRALSRAAVLFLAFAWMATPALAAHAPAEPKPENIPALANFLGSDGKAYFMGERSGLDGWFITKGNQVQMVYTTPDGKSMVAGVLFDDKGENVSVPQFQKLFSTNKEVVAFLKSRTQTALNNVTEQAAAAQAKTAMTAPATASTPSPGARLMSDLGNAAGVTVGPDSAPRLLMVIDPNCPHCQATWRALRGDVFGNKLQIRFVPIGLNDEDNRAAAKLLEAPNPLEVWDKYVGGDKSALSGTALPSDLAAVRANRELIDAWHIGYTPYLVYRAKSGEIKVVEGEPSNLASILDDLAR